jgi:outer membrane receptor protein involved in Fe transport
VQTGIFTVDETGMSFSEPVNVGRAKITGGEIEIDFLPIAALSLSAWAGYSHYETIALGAAVDCTLVAMPIPTPAIGANCTTDGLSLGSPAAFLPEVTAGASAAYTIRISGTRSLILESNANYQSRWFTAGTGGRFDVIGGRTLVDGGVTWQSSSRRLSAALTGTNLTGKEYYLNKFVSPWGQTVGEPAPPREWALTLKYAIR